MTAIGPCSTARRCRDAAVVDGSARSAGVARLFVAAVPPPAVLERLAAELARPERPGVRWTTRDQWHVTLRFLGQAPLRAAAAAALTGVRPPPSTPRSVRRSGRSVGGVLCLPVRGLDGAGRGGRGGHRRRRPTARAPPVPGAT